MDERPPAGTAAPPRRRQRVSIEVVTCAFANATTGDWYIPSTPEDIVSWLAAGYSTETMVATGKLIIDATMAAFPNQNVSLPIGSGPSDLDPDSNYLAATVVDYGRLGRLPGGRSPSSGHDRRTLWYPVSGNI